MWIRTIISSVAAVILLTSCQTPEPIVSKDYEARPQNARILGKLGEGDIAVGQVRVVNEPDLYCAGYQIPIPGAQTSSSAVNFASFWKRSFEKDLQLAGLLNEKDPKVKIYVLFEKVKMVAGMTFLQWQMEMRLFSSNGTIMQNSVEYNAPTDGLRNMPQACGRLAESLDKAVAWSILKTISSPAFEPLVKPGLGYVPTMKGQSLQDSLTSIIKEPEQDDIWKTQPKSSPAPVEN